MYRTVACIFQIGKNAIIYRKFIIIVITIIIGEPNVILKTGVMFKTQIVELNDDQLRLKKKSQCLLACGSFMVQKVANFPYPRLLRVKNGQFIWKFDTKTKLL